MARQVRDIMTGHPICVPPETEVTIVARSMRDEDVGALLVVEDGQLRGLVTDRDLVVRGLASGLGPDTTVGGVCSHSMALIGPDDDVDTAMAVMREHSVRRLPVVDKGRPIGIVSLGDIAVEKDPRSGLAEISAAEPTA